MSADPAANHPPERAVTRAEFLQLFAAVFLPMFMAAVDQTLLATATPAIAASLGGLRDTSWIAVGYLLAAATIVPVYGRLGDLRPRRDVLLAALVVFTTGSLACGISQSLPQLVAARVVQGLGGGGLMTLSQALIGELVPPRERARFQAYFAVLFMAASIGGPVIGGVVVSNASWRWLFFANVPLAIFAAWRLMRLPRGEHPARRSRGLGIPGHVLFAIGTTTTLFWLTSGGHRFAWTSVHSLALAAIGVSALAALCVHERRHAAPFFPVELLRERTIALSSLLVALFASCLFAVIFFLPIYLQLARGMTPHQSGLLLLPVTAGMVCASISSSRLLRRTGRPHWIPVIGMSISGVALLLLALLPPNTYVIAALGFTAGLGFGTVMPTTQVTVQTLAGRDKLASVTALVSLARSSGGASGAALFGAIAFASIPRTVAQSSAYPADGASARMVTDAFHYGFLCTAALAALAVFAASRIPHHTLWPGKPRRR